MKRTVKSRVVEVLDQGPATINTITAMTGLSRNQVVYCVQRLLKEKALKVVGNESSDGRGPQMRIYSFS